MKMGNKRLLGNYLTIELAAAVSVIASILEIPAGPLMPELSTLFSVECAQREHIKSM